MKELNQRLTEAERVTNRLAVEAGAARQSWALFEGLNGRDQRHRGGLHAAVNSLGLSRPFNGIVNALQRDALLTLMRMTDPPGRDNDSLTLCRISKLLEAPDLRDDRRESARNWVPNSPEQFADADAAQCAVAMKAITDLVPPQWTKTPPLDSRLHYLRTKLKPIRDSVLAHSIDTRGLSMPTVNDIREFLQVVGEAVEQSQLVFRGSSASWNDDYRLSKPLARSDRTLGLVPRGFGACQQ